MHAIGPHRSAQQTALANSGAPKVATFAGLMELYERNYILLQLLLANHDPRAATTVYHPDKRHRLQLTPLEHERYTTTLLLTYSLLNHRHHVLTHIVQLKIRLYRDTRQAELFRPAKSLREVTAGAYGRGKVVVVRWVLNKFLNKVLESVQPLRPVIDLNQSIK